MPREREHSSKRIKTVDYDIARNHIRAWYDGAGDLIFVLDETINADKPNVLLVIDSFDERKWDDVLSNDYGIDLETVRPKKDNKYQKLDIEYGGLDVYAELIDAYESDDDLDEPLENLMRFRTMSVRRAAKERLAAAEETADKSRDTIERTNDTIAELRARIKDLRAKLSEQKRNVGREPTKASASKILKTEAQIDATNEKLARAKKRLESAKRRLAAAEEDAEIARAILARRPDVKPVHHVRSAGVKRRAPVVTVEEDIDDEDENADDVDNEDDEYSEEYDDTETYDTKAEEMSDEEVKPLFDTDPEVLDDNIAFKPIDFNSTDAEVVEPKRVEPVVAPTPLSFTPPSDTGVSQYNDTDVHQENNYDAPVLDNLTSVQPEPEPENVAPVVEPVAFNAGIVDVNEQPAPLVSETIVEEPVPTPVVEQVEPIAAVEPVTPVRPVSPIGHNVNQTEVQYSKKPTFIYYLMLILLIGLSIFTLWLYQKKNGTVMPDLAVTTATSDTSDTVKSETTETNIPSPFVKADDEKVETASVAETVNEPEPVVEATEPVVEPEPVAVVASEPVAEPEPVPVKESEPVNVSVESPFVDLRTVATYEPEKKPIPSEAEILARKPGYNVSQNEKMFVASPEYDTETLVESVSDSGVNIDATYSMDVDVQPTPVPEIVASEVSNVELNATEPEGCASGMPADENGCCPGEEYSYTDDGYMCCADDGCFPPLQ